MSLRDRRLALLPVLALAALTAACRGDGDSGDGGSAALDTIPVAASDDACDVEAGELEAGTHEFAVTNGGSKVTEFYVYAAGDRVMGEVENIAPGHCTAAYLCSAEAGIRRSVHLCRCRNLIGIGSEHRQR